MTTVVQHTTLEGTFAELLAEVLRVAQVPADANFFDELGADSLVMAQFCARVRKRGNLPPVSMKDVYAHPTVRGLAKAVASAAQPIRPSAHPSAPAPSPSSAREYVLCGALQALFYLGYAYVGMLAAVAKVAEHQSHVWLTERACCVDADDRAAQRAEPPPAGSRVVEVDVGGVQSVLVAGVDDALEEGLIGLRAEVVLDRTDQRRESSRRRRRLPVFTV